MIHLLCRPIAFKKEGNYVLDEALTANPYPTWQKLEELVDKGKIRNIGISKCVFSLSLFFIAYLNAPQLQYT
jgi:hypothetical protein